MSEDIVAQLRKEEVGKYNALLWDKAADEIERLRIERDEARDEVSLLRSTVTDRNIEIERLRKERDEARRMVCSHEADTTEDQREYAKMRGWDCLSALEETARETYMGGKPCQ